jgi:hypothetical protein
MRSVSIVFFSFGVPPSPLGYLGGKSFLLLRLATVYVAKILHANELAAKYCKQRRSRHYCCAKPLSYSSDSFFIYYFYFIELHLTKMPTLFLLF